MRGVPGARRRFGALALILLLGACAAPQTEALLARPGALPPSVELADVPFFPQEKYYCGPAALATSLAWSGLELDQHDVAPQVYTPGREGSLPSDLVAAARRNGRVAVPITGLSGVIREIAAGHPVVVFQNLGLSFAPVWHFAVAVGYDLNAREIILRSAREKRRRTALDTFEHTWARGNHWAIVTLKPGQLPASVGEAVLVRATAGLERAGRSGDAAQGYRAIVARWKTSRGAWFGLGNTLYASGDRAGAEAAFRTATRYHPDFADAWNNLAHVLGERGAREAAIAAARKAVALTGGAKSAHRDTLRQLTGAGT